MAREETINQLKDFIILHRGQHGWDVSTLKALDMSIKALEQTRWIPVNEGLPEKTGLYLINIGDLVTTANFEGHYFRMQSTVRYVPDAWMPLPEPYEAESEVEE